MEDLGADVEAISRIKAVPTLLNVIHQTTGMGFVAVARVTEGRWVACGVLDAIDFGLSPGSELQVQTTICDEITDHRQPVIISNVRTDRTYCRHLTPQTFGFQSYVSVPIVLPDGEFFGTLCAIDPKPRSLDEPHVLSMFTLFADLIAQHLDTGRKMAASERALAQEREMAQLREEFIAILGHDLRNPLMAVDAGASLILRRPEHAAEVIGYMKRSIARMSGLIENVTDFARGRLGGGFLVSKTENLPLEPMLSGVVQELQSIYPSRDIELTLDIQQPVACDHLKLSQLLSNLLGNALTHGDAASPIKVDAKATKGIFELTVINNGERIPEEDQGKLFLPFVRGQSKSGAADQGLGLSLYISFQIAKAHGGSLTAASTSDETRFAFRMPI
ncbi:GAF domain-containing sensor histidine kinase [Lichenicoccus roseus]|uniref:histidine kinase n=1 Tax=Lichenicoccus roseus TaxID=2683649 RepID=A0A5R9J4X1_9PROT|nr:GAF domain-containing sensor histidine kinase [Lichenicoccus roseus]TLU71903.1 GAF domain-containing sensor histidine kinase [Lichenicoccus roseus]